MANFTINVDVLDSASIQKAINYYSNLDDKFDEVIELALPEIGERIKTRLLIELSSMGLGDSSLANSIVVDVSSTDILVTINSDHAIFLEFGTGIRGQQSPHPNTNFVDTEWIYDVNDHGEEGWWYPTTSSDPNPTKRVSSNGDIYAWTRGHESRPFMYNTWRYSRRMIPQVFNKYVRRVFR